MSEDKKEIQQVNNKVQLYTNEEISIIKNTVAKGVTELELSYFLNVAKSSGLNPFTKEIWCYKDTKGNLIVFAGRDGFLTKAQQTNRWNGITSFVVNENDVFSITVKDEHVSIEHKPNFKNPGNIIGAYAISKPKGTEYPTIEYVNFSVYNRGWNVWKTHPQDMIKKVAESHCLKKAYGISGIQSEYDFDTSSGVAVPIEEIGNKFITDEQVATLQEWIDKIENFNKQGFLTYIGAETIGTISEKNYDKALNALKTKAGVK